MSPASEDEEKPDVKDSGNKPDDVAATDATQKQAAKRRTKTGCLSECGHRFVQGFIGICVDTDILLSMPQKTNQVWRGKAGKLELTVVFAPP